MVQEGETRSRFCASQTSAGEAPLAGRAVCSRVERAWGSSAVHLGEVCAVPFASGREKGMVLLRKKRKKETEEVLTSILKEV